MWVDKATGDFSNAATDSHSNDVPLELTCRDRKRFFAELRSR
jgi:hypothetical protein